MSTYSEARQGCIKLGGMLANIHNTNEQLAVRSLLESEHTSSDDKLGVWIGYTNMIEPFIFAWEDASLDTFTAWAKNEPKSQSENYPDNCASMRQSVDWKWTNTRCKTQQPYVCEGTSNRIEPFSKFLLKITLDIYTGTPINRSLHGDYARAVMQSIRSSLYPSTSQKIEDMKVISIYDLASSMSTYIKNNRRNVLDAIDMGEGLRFQVEIKFKSKEAVSRGANEIMNSVYMGDFSEKVAEYYPNVIAAAIPRSINFAHGESTKGSRNIFNRAGVASSKHAVALTVSDQCVEECAVSIKAPVPIPSWSFHTTSEDKLGTAEIAGIIVGISLGVLLTVVAVLAYAWRRPRQMTKAEQEFEFVRNPLSANAYYGSSDSFAIGLPPQGMPKSGFETTINPLSDSPLASPLATYSPSPDKLP